MATIEVHVVSPEREIFSGEAKMIVAKGVDGDVGILPDHAPMLISLAVAPLRIVRERDEEKVLVDGGFLHVTPGEQVTRVTVLAEHAALASEIDAAAARSLAEELRRRVEGEGDAGANAELARTLMHARYGSR